MVRSEKRLDEERAYTTSSTKNENAHVDFVVVGVSRASLVSINDFKAEATMRLDVFTAMISAEKNIRESGRWEELSSEEKRLLEKMV